MPGSASFVVKIAGSDLPGEAAALLVSAYVDCSLRLPDAFMLRFRDPGRIVVEKSGVEIGSKVEIAVTTDAAPSPEKLISAEVTSLEAEVDATGSFTVIRGYDPAHRLFRGRHTESYTQATASDAVKKVAQRAGLSTGQVKSSSTVHDHIGQCGQTDWEFLEGMAKQIGYEVAVRDNKLDFGPRETADTAPSASGEAGSNPLVLRLGADILRFRAVITAAEQVGKVEVRGWDIAQKKKIVSTAEAGTKSVKLDSADPAAMAKPFGNPKYVASDIAYRKQSEADTAVKALVEEIGSSFAEIDAVARGNPKLRPDVAISIEHAGKPFDGKYTLTTVRHRYEPTTGYTCAFAVTGRQERSLYGLASGAAGRDRTAGGVVIAQVSDVNDPEHQGRVKLTFPWLSDDYVSDWARTVQAGAGKDRGAMVVPEVGDEVLVAFEQQDPARPYVIGGLFNGVDKPKSGGIAVVDSGSGAINRRSFISRNGHRIDVLDDSGKTEGIDVQTGDGKLRVTLDAVGTKITVHSDGTVQIDGKKGIVIESSSGDLEMKGRQIKMTAQQGVSVQGGAGQLELKTAGPVTVQGTTVQIN
ncbi:VgrG-related protein [Mycobacterium sp. 360MFTsu5.1]|uniref:VgrG-related protein n=1 Tax=Mycobacterium sp. 360MFTsu5.1 TaxID=1172186 RepID=UPI0003745E49|nr:VgrG-related protein [Mycobacterium sp. 360MFTsu5.1]